MHHAATNSGYLTSMSTVILPLSPRTVRGYPARMNPNRVLDRIEAALARTGLTANAVSIDATGNKDLIRNWRRLRKEGRPIGMTISSVAAVARVLGVSLEHLTGDERPGLAEDATPWTDARDMETANALRTSAAGLRQPQFWTASRDAPAFFVRQGDILIVDHGDISPEPGAIVLANVATEQGSASWTLRRYAAPWLLSDSDLPPLRESQNDPSVGIMGTVRGVLRLPRTTATR